MRSAATTRSLSPVRFSIFVARLAYFPLYAFGVSLVRSLVWTVAALGMTLMLVALLWK